MAKPQKDEYKTGFKIPSLGELKLRFIPDEKEPLEEEKDEQEEKKDEKKKTGFAAFLDIVLDIFFGLLEFIFTSGILGWFVGIAIVGLLLWLFVSVVFALIGALLAKFWWIVAGIVILWLLGLLDW